MKVHPLAAALPADDQSDMAAMAYAMLGNVARAREIVDQHEQRVDTLARRWQVDRIARVRGAIAMAEGKTDSAVGWFRRGDTDADGLPTYDCPPCTPYLLGIAFDRGGKPDSARKYLRAYVETTSSGRVDLDPNVLAPALLRLAQLEREAGDMKHATEYYTRFIDLWKNADADLQPRVTQARKELAEVTKAKG
jgi:tetratricopeptide (TPR) repeat protein